MRRLVLAAILAALAVAPAARAQTAVTLSTPDGAVHLCEQDFPGASYEANLNAHGYTERFELAGLIGTQDLDVILLCQPLPG